MRTITIMKQNGAVLEYCSFLFTNYYQIRINNMKIKLKKMSLSDARGLFRALTGGN